MTFEEDKDIFNKIEDLNNSSANNSISSDLEDFFNLHSKESNSQESNHHNKTEAIDEDKKEANYQNGKESNNQKNSRGPLIGTMMTYYNMCD